jgi:hypothetical protein
MPPGFFGAFQSRQPLLGGRRRARHGRPPNGAGMGAESEDWG